MRKEGEAVLKPNQAALIVTYGNTAHKQRSLDRDLFLLGRSPICDLTLVSPEVAPVHCILQRGVEGWRVRDCSGGRHAVRLNGCVVQEEALNDSDVLQIGAFSFELRLPASRPLPSSAPGVEERPTPLPPTLAELEKQAECLRGLQRDYQALLKQCEARLSEVECAERELCDERAAFERDCVERRVRLEQAERELARRQAELARAPVAQPAPEMDASATPERASRLDQRSRELHSLARYLQRSRRQLLQRMPDAAHLHEAEHWRQQCEQLQASWAILEARYQQHDAELKLEREQARAEARELAASLRSEIHERDAEIQQLRRQLEESAPPAKRESCGTSESGLHDRLGQLLSRRQDLAIAPSTSGSQSRHDIEL